MTTRWPAVARADFGNISRSSLVRGVFGVFALLVLAIVVLPGLLSGFDSPRVAFEFTSRASGTVVPIVALVAGYLSVAGERESGSIRVLLSLPPPRRDVVVGKFVARSGVVVGGILLAFALGGVASLLIYGELPVAEVVKTTALTAALGVTFVGIAVGFSAATASRSRAVTAAVLFFVVTVVLWTPIALAVRFLFGDPGGGPAAEWIQLLELFPPSQIFGRLHNSLVGSALGNGPPSVDAIYLSDPALGLLMTAWLVVPLALGYWRFARADLG
jgi:ABC-type transport system involved in multi-copper enzyme maturation permease subunit